MTNMQVNYQANVIKEKQLAEDQRANLAREKETHRTNVENEIQKQVGNLETAKHNRELEEQARKELVPKYISSIGTAARGLGNIAGFIASLFA